MSSLQLLVGAMIGVFMISMFADGLVSRALALLDAPTRERIWLRERSSQMWWRVPQYLGIGLMVFGLLRNFGMLKIQGLGVTQAIAGGLAVFCIASSLRAWLSNAAVKGEAPETPASRNALTAALLITVAEISLAGVIGWMVFKPQIKAWLNGTQRNAPEVSNKDDLSALQPGTDPKEGPAQQLIWVDEAEALRMLKGKSAKYLQALARRGDVRSSQKDGQTMYHRHDISQMKIAGLPTDEEIASEAKSVTPDAEKAGQ